MSKKPMNSCNGTKNPPVISVHEKLYSNTYFKIVKSISCNIITVLFYIGVIAFIIYLGKQAYKFSYPIFGDVSVDAAPGRSVKVTISEKDELIDIAEDLKEKGVIENKGSFYIRGKLSINKNRSIEPGTYILNTSENYGEILNILTNAEEVEN